MKCRTRLSLLLLLLILVLSACGDGSRPAAVPTPTATPEVLSWQDQYDLGLRYLSEGSYEEAVLAFTAAIDIDPKRAEAYVGRGDAYVGWAGTLDPETQAAEISRYYENAEADYLTAIDLDALVAAVYSKLADLYLLLGNTDAALAILERGIEATEDETLEEKLDALQLTQPVMLLISQTGYQPDGTPDEMRRYTYNEQGYMIQSQSFDYFSGSWEPGYIREVEAYEPGTTIGCWVGTYGKNHTVIAYPYAWELGTESHQKTITWMENPPKRVDNPHPEEEAWSYALYTYNEEGYAIQIDTYDLNNELSGTVILEWEPLSSYSEKTVQGESQEIPS